MSRDIYNDVIISTDANGIPTVLMAGVLVTVNLAGTSTTATIYQDRSSPSQKANPFQATNGKVQFWADTGEYDIVYHDTQLRVADQTVGWNSIPAGSAGILQSMMAPGVTPPVGSVYAYAGPNAPPGYRLLNGQALSKTNFAALYTALGGPGAYPWAQDATTFTLPDLRGRTIIGVGQGASLTNRTMGSTGGEEAHLLSWPESGTNGNGTTNAASTDHYHAVSASGSGTTAGDYPDHYHLTNLTAVMEGTGAGKVALGTGYGVTVNTSYPYLQGATARHQHNFSVGVSGGTNYQSQQMGAATHAHALNARDADWAHNNMQPFFALNWIIRDGT